MNILFTESSPNIGGQELQALAQMDALRRKGHCVLLACRDKSKIASEARRRKIEVIFVPFRNSLHIPSILKLFRIMRDFRPHLVICHSGHDSNIVGLTRLFIWRIRFRIIRQKTYLTRKTKSFSLNYFCDEVIVPGTSMRKHLIQEGVRTRITIVPPGFYFQKLREDSRVPLPLHVQTWLASGRDEPVIVQVGMLRPEKGHEFMLKLLSSLKQEGREFRWLIVGGGCPESEARLQSQVDNLGMHNNVLIAGNVFPASPVYQIASLLVMPSENESFGMVLAEASAFSVPVLASQVGGIPDVIQHNRTGTLLPVGDASAWIHALNDFFNYPERFYQMACQARVDVENRFDINRTVLKILALRNIV
ncbi:glycosyltransferase family 4 protein [Salmonella enterica]|uniref:Glycosyltransferase family 1 protein n=6 Tax=Salmonella enterica TaxID=28901 RepID=A0A2T8WRL3_SALET|nr:glycosyltransferase family 4 protein [Salmonella enterica]EBZ5930939.1 glycosyltransferase family 1 protein [Salmonella enterica subsp. enterica serovar Weslaco]EBZ6049756.1 glycosyltransferase family 1 protein [Salmonella enterica subsp. enterica serovar Texas]ECF6074886.1 glycosyltransferase family 4 protein [Salmonella enterica subsp. houtenae]EEJ6747835.1 glycosyltransferase family 4 protein [Salmonella enterica subsp. enterica serovar Oslo]EEO3017613.1 glycosyltransferase [Salmonella e